MMPSRQLPIKMCFSIDAVMASLQVSVRVGMVAQSVREGSLHRWKKHLSEDQSKHKSLIIFLDTD